MKKVFLTAMSVIAVAAMMMLVSCKKDDANKDNNEENQEEQKDEYTGPVTGESTWSLVGALLGANWDKDFNGVEADGIVVVKNVKLEAANEIKWRKDGAWAVNYGGSFSELGAGFAVTQDGPNMKPGLDGFYDFYLNTTLEQAAICEKDAQPTWALE